MRSEYQLFKQEKHPEEVDETYHIFSGANISNVFFWNIIFENLSKEKIVFDSIVECGVGRGRSLLSINQLLDIYIKIKLFEYGEKEFSNKIKVYGLDSFQGFPKPTKFDKSFRNPHAGEWSHSPSKKYEYNAEFINKIFTKAGVTKKYLELIKGFFDKTTNQLKLKNLKIGILHLDGDLYLSVKDPLQNLSGKVVRGGFIVFDDFILNSNSEDAFPGARKAYEEFINNNQNKYEHFPSVRGNVILKKTK